MEWINVFGLIIMTIMMIPNIIFAWKNKAGFENKWHHPVIEAIEQIGRFGCFTFMMIHPPGTWLGWWSDEAFALYLMLNAILLLAYCIIWIICFRQNSCFRALALSIIPSLIFLLSAMTSRSFLLLFFALLFAPSHILISYMNAKNDL